MSRQRIRNARLWLGVLLCTLGFSSVAAAQALIGIDFDNGVGSPFNWNAMRLPTLSLVNMIDEGGAATSVDFSLTPVPSGEFASIPTPGSVPAHPNPIHGVGSYFYGTETTTATFSDLAPSTPYNVWVFGLRAFTMNNRVTISGGGAPITFDQLSTNVNELWINGEVGSSARTLASYALVQTSTPTGQLTLSWLQTPGSTSTGWAIAGAAIQVIPEPASVGAGIMAAAVLLRRRRR